MSATMGRDVFYITTPIYYANDVPHIGHAYNAVGTDLIARWHRLRGEEVFHLTGTDEHGLKVQRAAEANGVDAQVWVDQLESKWREVWARLDIDYDDYIRTTEPRHHDAVVKILQAVKDNGRDDIYLGHYEGLYCVHCEAYYTESELLEGQLCPIHERPVELVREDNYFFRLSAYADRLLEHYEAHPEAVEPATRRNEVLSLIRSGLQDFSISRTTFDWGVPLPWDETHVTYVWFDALTNYITAAGYANDPDRFARVWPANIHSIGKDIIRFHAVYWPAFLMSAGIELPRKVFVHGFLLNRGEKMSKSVGNVVDPNALVDTFGVDQVRYFFLREVPFGQDGSYSEDAIIGRINSDLANELGNLAQRSLSMVAKNLDGIVPEPGDFTADDKELLAAADGLLERVRGHYDATAMHLALEAIWSVLGAANR
jgi:methionyl-tRNA synthetase